MSNIVDEKVYEIIKIIEKNPVLLKNLNVEQLKIIDDYYIKKIDECKKKLAVMHSSNKK